MIAAVRWARWSGDAQTAVDPGHATPARRQHATTSAAWRSPELGERRIGRPCQRPSAFQVDWPWRARSRRVGVGAGHESGAGVDELELAVAVDERGRPALERRAQAPLRRVHVDADRALARAPSAA